MKFTRADKLIVLLNCTVPVALLGWDALHHQLGANPVNFAIRTTGLLALIYLLLSLTITPAARLTGWNTLVTFRRLLGLYAFFHTVLHLGIFFLFDRAGSISSTLSEMVKRPYLVVGSIALLLMVPLAATSTDYMIHRLGPKRWKRLHRLAYVSAILGCLHYYMLVKADVRQPVAFAAVLAILLGYRVVAALRHRWAMAQKRLSPRPVGGSTVRPRFWSGQLRVARIFQETPDVRTFRLAPIEGDKLPFDYLPGQYLNLALDVDGQKVKRSYTIASTPTRHGSCEITIKRDGVASRHLHDEVREGHLLSVSAPAGRFTFIGTEAPSIVMIAGGVGITPLMAKIRYLTDTSWPGEIFLVHSARCEADLIFRDELTYLQRRHPNLHVLATLTRDDNPAWPGQRGRVTADLLKAFAPLLQESAVHLCGPESMTEPTRRLLRELGVPEDQIKDESFTSPNRAGVDPPAASGAPAAASTNGTCSVTFARSGQSTDVAADRSILEAAEDLGVEIDYDCRAGICGQCKTKLLSGEVYMESQDALDASDRAAGLILCCQAKCLSDVTVDA